MPTSPQTRDPGVEDAIADRLGRREVRFTSARRRVVLALTDAERPLTAAELHDALGDLVPLSSLYRSLAVLEETDVLSRQHDADGMARYELAEWLTGHHHHLVCTVCGAMEDVAVDPEIEASITRLIGGLAARRGYEAEGHRIDIEGTCPACRTQ